MASAKASSIVTMEILVEENVVLPVGIFLELLCSTINGALTACIAQEDA
jgi:hypothetical protein